MEWQYLESKRCDRIWSGGINNVYAGSLDIWIGILDVGFGYDGRCWTGTDMGKLDWDLLVKDNLKIPV